MTFVRNLTMAWKMIDLEEGTDYDRQKGFYRFKRAIFEVNGTQHTLKISMTDFDAGKTEEIVAKEAEKIMAALGKSK